MNPHLSAVHDVEEEKEESEEQDGVLYLTTIHTLRLSSQGAPIRGRYDDVISIRQPISALAESSPFLILAGDAWVSGKHSLDRRPGVKYISFHSWLKPKAKMITSYVNCHRKSASLQVCKSASL